ncbi:protein FAM118A-like [Spea bombifrons]|uniref:protein FAM118A-like n=1 Tax=Spea bombifrons TaxID=233779 RepID=UPI00234BA68E|nr:protein FAM118A-like [Spea bombifrons]
MKETTNKSEPKSGSVLQTLTKKHPGNLLIVIGTGVSASALPGIRALTSWRSCIEEMIAVAEQIEVLHPMDASELRNNLRENQDLMVVAHDLVRKMSPRSDDSKPSFYHDCLPEIFEDLDVHIQNPTALESILSLMERGAIVLTTNYDNLLEVYGQNQGKPMESLDLKDKAKVLQWARGLNKYGVLHIHGLYTKPCVMALDPFEYKYLTQDLELMGTLENLYSTKCFLFLGCGDILKDYVFQELFLRNVYNKVNLEHFMLVIKENEDHFFKLQADMLLYGIKLITYGDTFKKFPEYVKCLSSELCNQKSLYAENSGKMSAAPSKPTSDTTLKRKLDEPETAKKAK